MKTKAALEIVKGFDQLPDDMIVHPKSAAVLLGISERTLRRSPPIPKRKITARNGGYRVGDIRTFVRGENAAA
jgi:hypothetical protein